MENMERYQAIVDRMNAKFFHAEAVATGAEAKARVMELLLDAKSVGMGGSVTLYKIGVFDAVADSGKAFYCAPYELKKEHPDLAACYRAAMEADAYVSSTNALTEQGDLINIDGTANRIGAMCFGAGKLIIVAGRNKICRDPHDAIRRIKTEACPKNAKRLKKTTPCAIEGGCKNCQGYDRMCKLTLRMEFPPNGREVYVILVDEDLGY